MPVHVKQEEGVPGLAQVRQEVSQGWQVRSESYFQLSDGQEITHFPVTASR